MRAVVYRGAGDSGVAGLETIPDPEAHGDELVVDVAYAGLNRADILERQGRYGAPDRDVVHVVPGLEYAGTVADVGSRVRGFSVGERVFGLTSRGAHAERLAIPAALAMHVPEALDLERAAAIPEAFITAWHALYRLGGFSLGKTIVVHAAGSGVGLAALALVKAAGGITVGTSRSADKLVRASEHGLDYGALLDEDWPAVAMRVTNGRGADVVLDFVGPSIFDRNVAALGPGGCIVQIGTLAGTKGEVVFGPFMAKRASLVGTVLRARPIDEKIALTRAFERDVVPLFARGVLAPVVDRVFPLDEIGEAHRYMGSDANFGKILLKVR